MIIYCLDNSSFSQADSDGVISQIAKLKDNKYHVMGELIVTHEITMAAAVANLKQILAVCGDRRVFIITPLLRFINFACCDEAAQSTGLCTEALHGSRQAPQVHRGEVELLSSVRGRTSRRSTPCQARGQSFRGLGRLLQLERRPRKRRLLLKDGGCESRRQTFSSTSRPGFPEI